VDLKTIVGTLRISFECSETFQITHKSEKGPKIDSRNFQEIIIPNTEKTRLQSTHILYVELFTFDEKETCSFFDFRMKPHIQYFRQSIQQPLKKN